MDKFICPHCGKELDLERATPDNDSNFFMSYCVKCDTLYYLNGQKEIHFEVILGLKEELVRN